MGTDLHNHSQADLHVNLAVAGFPRYQYRVSLPAFGNGQEVPSCYHSEALATAGFTLPSKAISLPES